VDADFGCKYSLFGRLQVRIDTCDSIPAPLSATSMRIALYQPEIAGNVGAVLRFAACMGVGVDIIEPTGFVFSDARMKRAGMDYIDQVAMTRHEDWSAFQAAITGRLVLMTTKGSQSIYRTEFLATDILLFGRESSGVPTDVADACTMRIRIPIMSTARSLNLGMSVGIAVSEALRQTGGLPQ
jgi:tRNA (cytidine/uridine-2'-O-)-methyltransferase